MPLEAITHLFRSMEGTCHGHVCIMVLGAHLVLSVLAALCWLYVVLGAHLCVGYIYCGMLGVHLVQEGVALVKFQSFPISYGVTGHICIL